MKISAFVPLLLLALGSVASGQQTFMEVEPNGTKATANVFVLNDRGSGSGTGDRIVGTSGGGDTDRFRLGFGTLGGFTTSRLLGIGTGSGGGIHGLSLRADGTVDPASDPLIQVPLDSGGNAYNTVYNTAAVPAFNGLEYRVANPGATALYEAPLAQFPTTTTDINTVFRGAITITAGSETIDSDLYVEARAFGSEYPNPRVKANNDASLTTRGSRVSMEALPNGGNYTFILGDVNVATFVLPDADEFVRAGDPRSHMVGTNAFVPTSSATVSIPFTITDETGTTFSSVFQKSGYGVAAYSFSVQSAPPVPEPATLAALGFGALALLRQRRV